MGQSLVLSEIKAEIPLQNENRNRLSRRREAAPPEDNGHTRAAMWRSPAWVWTKITLARNTCEPQPPYTLVLRSERGAAGSYDTCPCVLWLRAHKWRKTDRLIYTFRFVRVTYSSRIVLIRPGYRDTVKKKKNSSLHDHLDKKNSSIRRLGSEPLRLHNYMSVLIFLAGICSIIWLFINHCEWRLLGFPRHAPLWDRPFKSLDFRWCLRMDPFQMCKINLGHLSFSKIIRTYN